MELTLDQALQKGVEAHKSGKLQEADRYYTAILKANPKHPDANHNMGVLAVGVGKVEEALPFLKTALEANSSIAQYWLSYIDALIKLDRMAEAKAALDQAKSEGVKAEGFDQLEKRLASSGTTNSNTQEPPQEQLQSLINLYTQGQLGQAIEQCTYLIKQYPGSATLFNIKGTVLQGLDQLASSVEAFNKALAIKPDYAKAWLNGAEALERWNKLDDLEIWLEKAFGSFELVPADLRFMKAKMLWRKKKYEETSNLIEDIKFETISEIRRQDYLTLKAKNFDHLKKFDEAFACFTQNNLLVKKSKEYPKHNPEQIFQNLRDSLDKLKSGSRINSKANSVENPEFSPTFLVGFPRSGTTLLDTILRSNSKIEVVEEQAMLLAAESFLRQNTHNDFVRKLIPPQLNLEAQKIYIREFNKNIDTTSADKVYIDKLPLNLLQAPLIHQLYPDAKFILALRHPMDAILSCWMQNFALNAHMANMVDLDRIVDFYCIAMETFKICRSNYNLNVHEIRYEDLINNFQKEAEAVVQFLNLQWEPEMENYQDTALKRGRIYTPSYSQVVQPIYKNAEYRWLNYRKYLEQYVDTVMPWIAEFGYD